MCCRRLHPCPVARDGVKEGRSGARAGAREACHSSMYPGGQLSLPARLLRPLWVSLGHTKPVAPRDSAAAPSSPRSRNGSAARVSGSEADMFSITENHGHGGGHELRLWTDRKGRVSNTLPQETLGRPTAPCHAGCTGPRSQATSPRDPVTWDVSSPSGASALRECQGSAVTLCTL